jgi:hypothetical protein
MNAAINGNDGETTTDIEVTDDENKGMTQDEINKKNFKPGYAFFVLFIVLMCRIMV